MAAPTTDRASLSTANVQGNLSSVFSSISKDGKIVAFDSSASNLVANDLNGFQDIFVRNRPSGKTTRVSRRSNGGEANGLSSGPHLSETGRFVAFTSSATNLIGLDGNSATDVFVHDRVSKKTKRVSTRSNGAEANGSSALQGISADGRYVVFNSLASNLVSNDTNAAWDVFLHSLGTRKTRRVSVSSAGAQGNNTSGLFIGPPKLSADGKRIAFDSSATNLVAGDTNATVHVFLHNRANQTTRRVSVRFDGTQANNQSFVADISSSGRFVTFLSNATNLVGGDTNAQYDVFVRGPFN